MRYLIYLVPLVLATMARAQQCYWPNHKKVPEDNKPKKMIMCPAGADGLSSCCYEGDYCTSNGLCLESVGWTMYRGACTDKSFNSPSCGRYCFGNSPGGVDGSHCGVWQCGSTKFACNLDECDNGNFTLPSGNFLANAALESDAKNKSATATDASDPAKETVTITNNSDDVNCSAGVSTGAAAGIGVGVGLPLLVAAVSLLVLYLKERKKSTDATGTGQISTKGEWSGGRASEGVAMNNVEPSEAAGRQRFELGA